MRRTIAERVRPAVVTDLDGCLLDRRTYSFAPAAPALARLVRRQVPLVLCTSKTRAEVGALWRRLGLEATAVVEDGAGLLFPAGALPLRLRGARRTRHGRLMALSVPYREVRRVFAEIRRRTAGAVKGFGDCTAAEIARLTGLEPAAARRAAQREFDEPFFYTRAAPGARALARRLAARRGMAVSTGGRFEHLHGPVDKGHAVRLVRRLLERRLGKLCLIALGDSPLDEPLLAEADVPIIVPQPDGRPNAALRRRMSRARLAPAPGPRGWRAAVDRALDEAGVPR